MASYTCPVCHESHDPAAQVGAVAVCANCGASYVVEDNGVRRATIADTSGLTSAELSTLRKARGRTR